MAQIVVLCGVPGSGKSTLATTRFGSYKRINLDTLHTRHREYVEIMEALKDSKEIIIDNTNTTAKTRKRYVDIAKQAGVPIKAIYLDCPIEIALERNSLRSGKERLPVYVVRLYYKRLEPPMLDEGFQSVERIASAL